MKAFFVTGTDTGVGKTTVSVAILAAAARRGLATGAMKPAESGCARGADGALVPADAEALRAVCTVGQSLDDICPYRLAEPVAPAVAAARAGISIDLAEIARCYRRLQARAPDLALVEGAGGLLVPYAESLCAADIARALELPILIVARPDLGTINHTLLTVEAARARGLTVAGVVFSRARAGTDLILEASNAEEIERLGHVRCFGTLPFSPDANPAQAAQGEQILDALTPR